MLRMKYFMTVYCMYIHGQARTYNWFELSLNQVLKNPRYLNLGYYYIPKRNVAYYPSTNGVDSFIMDYHHFKSLSNDRYEPIVSFFMYIFTQICR